MDESVRFLGDPEPERPNFQALGHSGSDHYVGLEVFDNPGCGFITYRSDEVMGKCPVTGQPDFYTCEISLAGTEKCIESKSLKLWFQNLMSDSFTKDVGIFCEALAVYIRETVCEAVEAGAEAVQVTLTQKSRGGISIKAVA